MTDTEINEAVARKLGWVQCCNPKTMENGKIVDCFGWSKGGSHFHKPYPDYCHSIEAAWEVVEWISRKLDPSGGDESKHSDGRFRFVGNGFRLEHHTENTEEKWVCTLPEIVTAPPYEEMNDDVSAEADTAPMAICLAFLKLDAVKV